MTPPINRITSIIAGDAPLLRPLFTLAPTVMARNIFLFAAFILNILHAEEMPVCDIITKIHDQQTISTARNVYLKILNESPGMKHEKAIEIIENTKTYVPKLKALLNIGKNVLDYPGLLRLGKINHYPQMENCYEMYIGAYLQRNQGSNEYDFRVLFNKNGIITGIENVVWRQ